MWDYKRGSVVRLHATISRFALKFVLLQAATTMPLLAQCPGGAATSGTVASTTITLCMHVQDVLRLTITNGDVSLGNPTTANYGALAANAYLTSATPLAAASTTTVSVIANRPYEISIAASASNFGTAPAGVSKPSSDVQWKNTGGSFLALSTTAASVFIGSPGTTGSATLSFQSRWAYERDKPGLYKNTISITLAAR